MPRTMAERRQGGRPDVGRPGRPPSACGHPRPAGAAPPSGLSAPVRGGPIAGDSTGDRGQGVRRCPGAVRERLRAAGLRGKVRGGAAAGLVVEPGARGRAGLGRRLAGVDGPVRRTRRHLGDLRTVDAGSTIALTGCVAGHHAAEVVAPIIRRPVRRRRRHGLDRFTPSLVGPVGQNAGGPGPSDADRRDGGSHADLGGQTEAGKLARSEGKHGSGHTSLLVVAPFGASARWSGRTAPLDVVEPCHRPTGPQGYAVSRRSEPSAPATARVASRTVDEPTMRERVTAARVARLATVTGDGRPHLVPCCFVLAAQRIYSAVDAKPKTTLALRRLANIEAEPAVALLVDHYDDDWSALWWVRLDGTARVVADPAERARALALLAAKYPQYARTPPPGDVIAIEVSAWRGWP